jgi:homoserine dehydrogenase
MRDQGGSTSLVGVVTAHHGGILDKNGIDPGSALLQVETDALDEVPDDFDAILDQAEPQLVMECIPQNIRSGEPSLSFLRSALDRGIHAVTSNKAPIALAGRDLRARAQQNGVQIRFEATVLDGLPLFLWMAETPSVRPVRLRGILNATSSMVLESVCQGGSRARGLARAQARGIAEADAVLDLDGWDAAAKAALLANVWMDAAIRVVDVVRSGCDDVKDAKLREAEEAGLQYRLVAEVERDETGNIKARVGPVGLEAEDPLYGLRGSQGALEVFTEDGRAFCLRQSASGLQDAAAGMLMDVDAILAGRRQP